MKIIYFYKYLHSWLHALDCQWSPNIQFFEVDAMSRDFSKVFFFNVSPLSQIDS